jgi:hypothetical protein
MGRLTARLACTEGVSDTAQTSVDPFESFQLNSQVDPGTSPVTAVLSSAKFTFTDELQPEEKLNATVSDGTPPVQLPTSRLQDPTAGRGFARLSTIAPTVVELSCKGAEQE